MYRAWNGVEWIVLRRSKCLEANYWTQVPKHPNLVTVRRVWRVGGVTWHEMDGWMGGSLHAYVQALLRMHRRPTVRTIKLVAVSVLAGLRSLHRAGL